MDAATQTSKSAGAQSMDKQQFLKLFTTQLQHQDPLNPMDTSQFSSQLAQLTTVEQMMNMNKGVEKLISLEENMNRTASTGLIGNLVKLNDGSEGRVMGVRFEEGGPFMLLDNNMKVAMADIKEAYKPGFNPEPSISANNNKEAVNFDPNIKGVPNDIKSKDAVQDNMHSLLKGASPEPKVDWHDMSEVSKTQVVGRGSQDTKASEPKMDWHDMSEVSKTQVVGRGAQDTKGPEAKNLKGDVPTEKFENIENIPRIK